MYANNSNTKIRIAEIAIPSKVLNIISQVRHNAIDIIITTNINVSTVSTNACLVLFMILSLEELFWYYCVVHFK